MADCIPSLPEILPFRTAITVYINDLVGGVHVGNHVLISYLNESQMRLLQQMGFPTLTVDRAFAINAEAHVRYLAEVRYGDPLEVHAGVARLDADGFDLAFRMVKTSTGKAVLCARFGMTFVDLDTGRKVPVPEKFRTAAQAYLISPEVRLPS